MTVFRQIGAIVALIFLNTLLTLQNIWPTPWVQPTTEISVELTVILLLLTFGIGWGGDLSRRVKLVLVAVLLVLIAGRYADITAPALFGRRVDLFWDAPHLPRIVEMVVESRPLWEVMLLASGILLTIAVLVLGIKLSVDALAKFATYHGGRRLMAGLSAGLLVLYGTGLANLQDVTKKWFALPVTPVYAEQVRFLAQATQAGTVGGEPLTPSNLQALRGADTFLIFLESYGAGVFEDDRMRTALAEDFEKLRSYVDGSGWHVASAFLESPTFGGASWLAHLTTLSGRWIAREADYRRFLTKPPETLVDRFRDAGYRTIALLPGIQLDWPEGAALRFDRILDARALKYKGPAFGWWTIPDQFSLETLYQWEMAQKDRKPLFVQFASIMSHMPFGPTPPYQPNWERMTSTQPFDPAPLEAALQLKPDWNDITAGYLRTIRYDLQLIQGFLEKRAPRDAFLVVSGDHQPPAIVSGKDASWSVPVHIFARDPALIERFYAAGFEMGLYPKRPTLARMDAFNAILLKALDTSAGLARR